MIYYTIKKKGLQYLPPALSSNLGGLTITGGYVYLTKSLRLARKILEWKGPEDHSIYRLNLPEGKVEPDQDQILNREELPDFVGTEDWEDTVGSYYRIWGGIPKHCIVSEE